MTNPRYKQALWRGMAIATTLLCGLALVLILAWTVPCNASGRMPTTLESIAFTGVGVVVVAIGIGVVDGIIRA